MVDNTQKLLGRGMFEQSMDFGKRYIIHKSENEHILQSLMEGHVLLFKHYGYSPRFWFTATQGTSGKTTALNKSSLFVPNPQQVSFAGAGLLRDLHEQSTPENAILPTVLYEEVQEVFNGNPDNPVRHMLSTYKAGKNLSRPITAPDGSVIRQRIYYPVLMDGLINKYPIPPNFLERCIQIQMIKRKSKENVEDFEQMDLEEVIGDEFRIPRMEWASKIEKEDIRAIHSMVKEKLVGLGIDARDRELLSPLMEFAWFCGDDTFEKGLKAAAYYSNKKLILVTLTIEQELLESIYEICVEKTAENMLSKDLITALHDMSESPWLSYGTKQDRINQHNVAILLRPYELNTYKDSKGFKRYDFKKFVDVWERVLNKPCPEHLR